MNTLAAHLRSRAVNGHPQLKDELEDETITPTKNVDPSIEAELEPALPSTDERFTIRGLPVLAHLITKYGMGNPLDTSSSGSLSAMALSLKIVEAEIELEKWELFKQEIDFDKKTIHVHYTNLLAHRWAAASERDRWRTKVRKDHGDIANKCWQRMLRCWLCL